VSGLYLCIFHSTYILYGRTTINYCTRNDLIDGHSNRPFSNPILGLDDITSIGLAEDSFRGCRQTLFSCCTNGHISFLNSDAVVACHSEGTFSKGIVPTCHGYYVECTKNYIVCMEGCGQAAPFRCDSRHFLWFCVVCWALPADG
jgi:hypothetical protein